MLGAVVCSCATDVARARADVGRISALVGSLEDGYAKRKFQQALRDAEYDISNAERNVVGRTSQQVSSAAEQVPIHFATLLSIWSFLLV